MGAMGHPQEMAAVTTDTYALSMEFGALILALAIFGGVAWFTITHALAIMQGHSAEHMVTVLVCVMMVAILKIREIVRE